MNYQNFVFKLTPAEITLVETDVELYFKGFRFHYAIDTYDIIDYCMPYTDSVFNNPDDRNHFAQKVIAYSHFFKKNVQHVYVCRQYREEIGHLRELFLQRKAPLKSALPQNIQSLQAVFKKAPGETEDAYTRSIRENLELVITLMILEKEYPEDTQERHQFIRSNFKKMNLEKSDYDGKDPILNQFQNIQESALTALIFDSFVDEIAISLLNSPSRMSRFHYLSNSYLDIEVVCRLVDVNRALQQKGMEKNLVVYLSSAPVKSQVIFRILTRLTKQGLGLPTVNKLEKFNFHRNIFQVFLYQTLIEKHPNDQGAIQTILRLFRKIVERQQLVPTTPQNLEKVLASTGVENYEKIKQLLSSLSTNIENHFYYEALLEGSLSGKGHPSDPATKDLYAKAYSIILEEEKNLISVNTLVDHLSEYSNAQMLVRLFLSYDTSQIVISAKGGQDIIQNTFHCLPYLVFLSDPVETELKEVLYAVLNSLSFCPEESFDADKIVLLLKQAITLLNFRATTTEEKLQEAVITVWVNVLVGFKNDEPDARKKLLQVLSEKEIIQYLEKYQQVIRNLKLSPEVVQNEQIHKLNFTKDDIPADIGYLLLWLLRRSLFFESAHDLGVLLLKAYPNDARVNHGIGLNFIAAYYQKYYLASKVLLEAAEERERNDWIVRADEHLQAALRQYHQLAESSTISPGFRKLVIKCIIGIYNSLVDMRLRAYIDIRKLALPRDLELARTYLKALKQVMFAEKFNYEYYTLYHYTEAELEYYEALWYFQQKDVAKASAKILYATNRVYRAQERETSMNNTFLKIIKEIDQLRTRIFKELNIIKS